MNSPNVREAIRQKRCNRNNSGNAFPGFPNADVKRFIVPKWPSERRALLKSRKNDCAGGVRYRSHTKQRSTGGGGKLGYGASLHLDGARSSGAQSTLFGGGLGDLIDGYQHPLGVGHRRLRQVRTETRAAGFHRGGYEDIADI